MPGIRSRISTIVPRTQPYGAGCRDAARAARASGLPEAIARGFENVDDNLNMFGRVLRQNAPQVEEFLVTDHNGRVLAALGQYEVDGIEYSGGYFTELRAGDPFGESNPANSILTVTPDGRVGIGENGWLDVLDPFGESGSWLGTQADTLAVTGAADNGSGAIRLEVIGHTLLTGDTTTALRVGGVENATGIWGITKIDSDHIDLVGSVWDGAYTSGGTVNRVLHVSGAADNGAGLVRIQTSVAHTYESGDRVNLQNVGGVSAANGQWTIEVVDSTHFDLTGSSFSGAYTSGGVALRFFAGGLFGTIAIGDSFANYKLRGFADGSLKIRDAEIVLTSVSGSTTKSIVIDPDPVGITIQSLDSVTGGLKTELRDGWIGFNALNPDGTDDFTLTGYLQAGYYSSRSVTSSVASSEMVELTGYSGSTVYGPLMSFTQSRGSIASPTATQSGDTLGGFTAYGYDGTGEAQYSAAIRAVATENHSVGSQGTKIVFEYTPNGSATPTQVDLTSIAGAVAGASNLTTAGRVVLVSSAGTVTQLASAGITGSIALSLTTNTIQYKDWAGVNQSMSVVTNATLTANAFTSGVRTT